MRDIKFRVFRTDTKEMYETASIQEIATADTLNIADFEVLEIMQFTGLPDKNGVEIYEGDICRIWSKINYYRADRMPQKKLKAVKWNDKTSGFNIRNGQGLEVIGNIYENPELLK